MISGLHAEKRLHRFNFEGHGKAVIEDRPFRIEYFAENTFEYMDQYETSQEVVLDAAAFYLLKENGVDKYSPHKKDHPFKKKVKFYDRLLLVEDIKSKSE